MLFPTSNIISQELTGDLFAQKGISLSVLRLDLIHPVVSGNKLFKLHYFLQNAIQQSAEGIVSFGGPYSNHLVATAYACKVAGLKSVGIVRGEQPVRISHTLSACLEYGMKVTFVSREEYDNKSLPCYLELFSVQYKNYLVVPEGGYHPLGASGASLIMDFVHHDRSHICCAVGTATTVAGLLLGAREQQQIISIPVLKNMHDIQQRAMYLMEVPFVPRQLQIMKGYHFGGYAKHTPTLLNFMNQLYDQHQLPTDFVYTGKMMFAVMENIKKGFFPPGSKIVCLHTGGLQGNASLPPGTLVF